MLASCLSHEVSSWHFVFQRSLRFISTGKDSLRLKRHLGKSLFHVCLKDVLTKALDFILPSK